MKSKPFLVIAASILSACGGAGGDSSTLVAAPAPTAVSAAPAPAPAPAAPAATSTPMPVAAPAPAPVVAPAPAPAPAPTAAPTPTPAPAPSPAPVPAPTPAPAPVPAPTPAPPASTSVDWPVAATIAKILPNPSLTYSETRDSTNRPVLPYPAYSLVRVYKQYGFTETYYRRQGVQQWYFDGSNNTFSAPGFTFTVPGVTAQYVCWAKWNTTILDPVTTVDPPPATLKMNETSNRACPQYPIAPNLAAPARWNWVTVVLPSARPGRANVCIGVGGFGDSFACARIDQSGNIDADNILWIAE